jgi:hypothetical protein
LVIERQTGGKLKAKNGFGNAGELDGNGVLGGVQPEGAAGIAVAVETGKFAGELAFADSGLAVEDDYGFGGCVGEGGADLFEKIVSADEGEVAAGGDVATEAGWRGW